jgi:hypothetical protein
MNHSDITLKKRFKYESLGPKKASAVTPNPFKITSYFYKNKLFFVRVPTWKENN